MVMLQFPVDEQCIWTRGRFDQMVERYVGEELQAFVRSGAAKMAVNCDLPVLRELVLYNINLHCPVAGHA